MNCPAERSWLRRCWRWTIGWAGHPKAETALFLIALIEASVFPVPPDVLLIAMAMARPASGLRLAGIATLGSTAGAALGYGIGMFFFASVAGPVLDFYGAMDEFARVQEWFAAWGLGVVLLAGFSPIPFKVVTIAAGVFGFSFPLFLLACLVSRGARFYLEGALLRWGGERLRAWVERRFDWIAGATAVLVVAGFAALWMG